MSCNELAKELSLPLKEVKRIQKMVASSEHKRKLPLLPNIN
ncbi:MAG: hypothetical protein AB1485_08570 [Candidatus Thermoplasmatota archaeon]